MFNDTVSCFKHFGQPPYPINLINWINTCGTGGRYKADIEKFRASGDKSLKKNLPIITVGGLFNGGRRLTDLITSTGWVAIDIDYKDNPGLPEARIVRDEIAKIVYVAYSGLSVSGKGVWALIKVKDPTLQHLYFEQLKKDFLHIGIVIDPTKGRHPNDARFLSFDPDAKLKKEFEVYDRMPMTNVDKERPVYDRQICHTKIAFIIQQVAARQINIAPDYETYLKIGFALADEFGEDGRRYFHEIVRYSEKYNNRDADKQYNTCLLSGGRGVTIGTLFHYCKINGIELSQNKNYDFYNHSIAPFTYNLRVDI